MERKVIIRDIISNIKSLTIIYIILYLIILDLNTIHDIELKLIILIIENLT